MNIKSIKAQKTFTLVNFTIAELTAMDSIRSGDDFSTYFQYGIIMALYYGIIWNFITAKPDDHKYNYINLFFLITNIVIIYMGIVGSSSEESKYMFIFLVCFAIAAVIFFLLKYRLHKL